LIISRLRSANIAASGHWLPLTDQPVVLSKADALGGGKLRAKANRYLKMRGLKEARKPQLRQAA
jgi:hypothetical protein